MLQWNLKGLVGCNPGMSRAVAVCSFLGAQLSNPQLVETEPFILFHSSLC